MPHAPLAAGTPEPPTPNPPYRDSLPKKHAKAACGRATPPEPANSPKVAIPGGVNI
jgi:hypothetical protein